MYIKNLSFTELRWRDQTSTELTPAGRAGEEVEKAGEGSSDSGFFGSSP